MRDSLGIHFSITVNFSQWSEERDQFQHIGSADFQFGVNKLPTKEEADAAIETCLNQARQATGDPDLRITTMEDFGFASPRDFDWVMG